MAIPSASSSSSSQGAARRRTPPLGRALQRTPRGRAPLFSPASPPNQLLFTPTIAGCANSTQLDVFDFSEIGSALAELMAERSPDEQTKMEVDEEVSSPFLRLCEPVATVQRDTVGINVSFGAGRN